MMCEAYPALYSEIACCVRAFREGLARPPGQTAEPRTMMASTGRASSTRDWLSTCWYKSATQAKRDNPPAAKTTSTRRLSNLLDCAMMGMTGMPSLKLTGAARRVHPHVFCRNYMQIWPSGARMGWGPGAARPDQGAHILHPRALPVNNLHNLSGYAILTHVQPPYDFKKWVSPTFLICRRRRPFRQGGIQVSVQMFEVS